MRAIFRQKIIHRRLIDPTAQLRRTQ